VQLIVVGSALLEFTTVCTLGKRELLARLLQAGVRIPTILTSYQTYLLEHPDMLRTLLEHGMNPDLMNWQHQTLLHFVCNRPDSTGRAIERAAILLDAGATISARDDECRSTPLAWAARTNSASMVKFLLARGAPTNLPDDQPWGSAAGVGRAAWPHKDRIDPSGEWSGDVSDASGALRWRHRKATVAAVIVFKPRNIPKCRCTLGLGHSSVVHRTGWPRVVADPGLPQTRTCSH
jgi:hypothetical protein